MHKAYRWNGRIVRKSIYERNKKLSEMGKRSRKSVTTPVTVKEEHDQQNSNNENCTNEDTDPLAERISTDQEMSKHEPENDSVEDEMSSEESNPIEGRRIVDLGYLARRMRCDFCRRDLVLRKIEKETRVGFASILHIRCEECLLLNKIPTGSQHESKTSFRSVFNINSEIVHGAVKIGIGHAQLNKLMRSINVPSMASTTFRKHQREMSPVIEKMAFVNCKQEEEPELTIKSEDLSEDDFTAEPDVPTN